MRNIIHRTLLAHPHSVGESYFQHLLFASKFAGSLFIAGFAALLHAVIPVLCERTASNKINELHHRMHNR